MCCCAGGGTVSRRYRGALKVLSGSHTRGDSIGDGVDAVERGAGCFSVGEFEAEFFLEGNDELECVNGIESKSLGAENGGICGYFFGTHWEHEFGDHEFSDLLFEGVHLSRCRLREPAGWRQNRPPSIFNVLPVMYAAAGEARKTTAEAISSGFPKRRMGTRDRAICRCSGFMSARAGVSM